MFSIKADFKKIYSKPKATTMVEFQTKQNFISENATYFLCCQVVAAKVP